MSFCLPKEFANKFIDALKSGKIDPEKLIDMTSAERRAFLEPIVGEASVHEVNALLESKLLLKDQKRGLVSWAKKVSGITQATRTDLLSKIERLDKVLNAADEKAFLEDLAAKRLGTEVTHEEAQNVVEATKEVRLAREAIPEGAPNGSPAIMDYGLKYRMFQKYISELKSRGTDITWKEWLTSPSEWFNTLAGTTKSVLSSLDNSFFGRQGIKTLYTNPSIWAKNFAKSWGDIARELAHTKKDIEPLDLIKAEIFSRENARNGKYDAMNLDVGIASEEAFPSTIQEKIPLLGRFFKAADTAFSGGALRMRADLADKLIPQAEKFGVDMKGRDAEHIGGLINTLTGRGDIGQLNVFGGKINAAIFSIKFVKANIDLLLKPLLAPAQIASDFVKAKAGVPVERSAGELFARKEAAKNLLKITAATAGILYLANTLWPGSVEFDPRSPDFGKIKIGKHTIDVTGGLGSVVTLAARMVPTVHDGKLGWWIKSKSGKWTQTNSYAYGAQNTLDTLENFGEGKLSPIAGFLRDVAVGQDFSGNKIDISTGKGIGNAALGTVTPLPIQTFQDLHEPDNATALGLMILDGLGLSVNTTNKK